jgi:hypothetical protein
VRVALGKVVDAAGNRHDHAWVLYKSEAGTWRLVEPLALRHAGARRAPSRRRAPARGGREAGLAGGSVTYQPSYLFNADHLWAVPHHGHPGSFARVAAREWRRMSPAFAGDVHRRIVETALEDIASPEVMTYLRGRFRNLPPPIPRRSTVFSGTSRRTDSSSSGASTPPCGTSARRS